MKQLLVMVLFVSTAITADAQLSYGIKAGVNIAKISLSNDAYTVNSKIRLYGGVLANYKVSDKASVQAEVLYSGEGTKEKLNSGSSGEIKKAYLQIPVLFQYDIAEGFYAEAGPQLGFLLSSKEEFNSVNNDIKKYYKSKDLRIPVGVGYKFNGPLTGFGINARYSFSLSKINKTTVLGGDLKNKVFSVGLQYSLSQLKK